jgi:drug/metabolite transporter (DMT)-like permease
VDPARRARLQVVAAAALFSTGGALIKAISLTPWQVAAFRSAFGAAAILAMAPESRRGYGARTALVGCAYAATVLLFVLANRATTSANAIFLQSTAPLWLLLLGPWLLREPVRARDLGPMAALALGLACFLVATEAPRESAPDPALGDLLALASGLTWALTVAGLRWLSRREGTGTAAAPAAVLGNVIAFAVALPFALPVTRSAPADWGLVALLGVFQIGLAYVFLTRASRHVPALEAALLLLVEPVLNPLWAFLLHGETPGPWAFLGAALILAATAWQALRRPA